MHCSDLYCVNSNTLVYANLPPLCVLKHVKVRRYIERKKERFIGFKRLLQKRSWIGWRGEMGYVYDYIRFNITGVIEFHFVFLYIS